LLSTITSSCRIFGSPDLVRHLLYHIIGHVAFAAVGLGTEALPSPIAIIRKKIFLAVQTLASTLLSFHWVPEPKEPLSQRTAEAGKTIPWE